jgi:hypothetical protein
MLPLDTTKRRIPLTVLLRSTAEHTAQEWKNLFTRECANLGQSPSEVMNEFVREFVLDPPVMEKKHDSN